MKQIRHMSVNLEGMLRNFKGRKIRIMEDENGRTLSDSEARAEIARLQALGHKLMCCSNECEGFDPFGGGCPGHPVEDQTTKLLEAKQFCDDNDKSTEFMLQYMQDYAGVDLDCVLDFLMKGQKS